MKKRGREEDYNTGTSSQKRARAVTKEPVLKALVEFKAPGLCCHNSYCEDMPLDDERINGSDMKRFVMFSDQLPFTGRGSELGLLEDSIKRNIDLWTRLKSKKFTAATADTYQHLAVATGPGRGKTTLMQRGMLLLMCKRFKDEWSGRAFSWDLVDAPTDTELRLMRDHSTAGFQTVLATIAAPVH
jgi:hypothetical protein